MSMIYEMGEMLSCCIARLMIANELHMQTSKALIVISVLELYELHFYLLTKLNDTPFP